MTHCLTPQSHFQASLGNLKDYFPYRNKRWHFSVIIITWLQEPSCALILHWATLYHLYHSHKQRGRRNMSCSDSVWWWSHCIPAQIYSSSEIAVNWSGIHTASAFPWVLECDMQRKPKAPLLLPPASHILGYSSTAKDQVFKKNECSLQICFFFPYHPS